MVKVTVIVAVYNPGRNVDQLLESFDAQTMSPDEFEVIFADDDSTDGSRERLQEWAGTRPNVSVLHNTPNSGWPGRPRNLGIDAAQGEYVFFADNDDKFPRRALDAMYDYAVANDADVLIAKEAGIGPARPVARAVFRKNIPDAKLGVDPILGILTPHKLVRTAMVREHGIRFPEGKVRLEDHNFIMQCLFAAKRISVLADTLCYYWMRRDAGGENAAFSAVEPADYYASVKDVLEIVERNTEPGDFRNKLYSHWYDTKMLARLRGRPFLRRSADNQDKLVAALRDVSERFGMGENMLPFLGAGARARAELLMHGTVDDLRVLAEAEQVTSVADVPEMHWTDDGKLSMVVHSEFRYSADKRPLVLREVDDRVLWDVGALAPQLPLEAIDITDVAPAVRLDILLVDRDRHDILYQRGTSRRSTQSGRLGATAEVLLDPAKIFRGRSMSTVVDLRARLTGAGWSSEIRVPMPSTPPPAADEPAVAAVGTVEVYGTKGFNNASLKLDLPATDPVVVPGPISGPEVAPLVAGALDDVSWATLGRLAARRARRDRARIAGAGRARVRRLRRR